MSDITQILDAVGRGDAKPADESLPLVYEELRKLAAARMANEAAGHALQPTALVHEAWLANTITISWPAPSTDFVLQQNTNGLSSVISGIRNDGTSKTLVVNPTGQRRFYRLFHP